MAVRRSTDSLAKELASLTGVSPDFAVFIALSEAIARGKDPEANPETDEEPEADSEIDEAAGLIREIVLRQIGLVSNLTEDEARATVWEEMGVPIGFGLLGLTGGAFFEHPLKAFVLAVVLMSVALLYYYSRTLRKRTREAKQAREEIRKEIEQLGERLPCSLQFLREGTADDLLLAGYIFGEDVKA